ncbi:MAG: putative inner rane protein [Firmicutes bacterium]|nr:putative inner rane protein [Bacillota bacterium]
MERKEYSAGMVKLSFWFAEFRKVIELLISGKTLQDIKPMNAAENIFSAPTQARAIQIFNTISTRVKGVDSSFYAVFSKSDISNQKMIALIAVMQTDSLFFDFMYEVYREKLILGIDELADRDVGIFFKNKQLQSEKVAKWTDYTLKRLGRCYKTMLMEAGLIDRITGSRKIVKPIIDKSLEECLKANGMETTLRALTGVR